MKRIIKFEEIICDACGQPIQADQFRYQIKLDDGTIKDSHGVPCVGKFGKNINRIPIQKPDWWIRQVGNGGLRSVVDEKSGVGKE